MPVNNRDRELRNARREESLKWFQESHQRWEKVQESSEASQIIASLYAQLRQNPRRHESTSESIAAKHFSGFVSEPALIGFSIWWVLMTMATLTRRILKTPK